MSEGEKYNFYVHSEIKEKVVIINITATNAEYMHVFLRQFLIIYKVTYCSRPFIPKFLRSFDTQIRSLNTI